MTLVGEEVKAGERAPDFQVVDTAMQPASLGSFKGKVKIISSVPSLDTPVCDMETRRFNEEAGKLPENAVLIDGQHGPPLCPEALVRARRGWRR